MTSFFSSLCKDEEKLMPIDSHYCQKIPSYSSSLYRKTPRYKKSAGKILKFDFFNPLIPLTVFLLFSLNVLIDSNGKINKSSN
jgi:hypothetical protein